MPIPKKEDLSAEYLRSIINYDPISGLMTWKVKKIYRINIGDEVGRRRPDGYRHVKINSKMYLVHRLAWLFAHGEWPDFIDHINMVRDDNRLSNLRNCDQSQNGANRTAQANNVSSIKGVHLAYWGGGNYKWKAQIYHTEKGKKKIMYYLGAFDTSEEAAAAYATKAKELFGEFSRIE